jgi:hypothetical protein
MALEAKVDHSIEGLVSLNDDTTAIASVATVRTTSFNILFAPETQAAVTAFAGVYIDTCLIYKFHLYP